MALSIQIGRNIHIDDGLYFCNKLNELLVLLNRLNYTVIVPVSNICIFFGKLSRLNIERFHGDHIGVPKQ